jgi:hypothetical protein
LTLPNPVLTAPSKTKRSVHVAHDDLVGHRSVIFHVDLEHVGDNCGVLQLLVVAHDPTEGKIVGKFDKHIKPPATAIWSNHASEIHGRHPNDERITSAVEITEVWSRFVRFIEGHLANGTKKGIIAAWGGQSCNHEWLFRVANTRIMECCLFVGGVCVSWTPKRLCVTAPVAS